MSFFPGSALWSLDIQDQQALINVNTAPYQVILNLMEYLRIGGMPGDGSRARADRPGQPRQMAIAWAIATYRTNRRSWVAVRHRTRRSKTLTWSRTSP